ncbi:hypothetical protein PFICI_11590 [Pestalotiopsis fici W106-1]|uniref:Uncharacterized protein n=1 Tax=Pestalotiopsis fici (strain W106-1 / CGMCC3.15140) TaxID=1229662 RepID=W3WQT1_PESFW|nr:uncharacterized protein PFICI_11590 [Pestalotiopsis fici W106-1]ETS76203.1 hypothetical protein PFICI_11590 [Pestalotiopsis fici W106-1]
MLNTTKLVAIESSSQNISSKLHQINSRVEAIQEPSMRISTHLPVLQDSVDSVAHRVEYQSGLILDRIQKGSQNVQEGIHQSMEIQFKQQQEEFEKRFGQLFKMLQRPDPNVSVAPSTLQELCDSVQTPKQRRDRDLPEDTIHSNSRAVTRMSQDILQRTSVTGRECICHRSWRAATGKSTQMGHVYFSSAFATQRHWPSCPQSQWAPTQSRKTWGVKYTGLTRILKAAVDISFSYTFGAGGFSICPNFTYYPTVNDETDCAFQVLEVLYSASWRTNREKMELLMASCIKKLVKIFDGKKALPWSVNDRNESLVHCMTEIVRFKPILGTRQILTV